jgi:DNA invertase Pin-like site-specific DNA recombinase
LVAVRVGCHLWPLPEYGLSDRMVLEAQREAVATYLRTRPGAVLVDEHVEVESGKRRDRPELAKALAVCRGHRAALVVAKLDRLARAMQASC